MDSSLEAYGTHLASHIMGWCPLLVTPQGVFELEMSPLSQGGEIYDLLILYSNRAYPLSVSAMTVGVHRRQSLAIYPVSVVYFHFRQQTGGCL